MIPTKKDPIARLRRHKGKTLMQTVTDTDQMNELCGEPATQRLKRFKLQYPECVVRHIGLTTYVYA